MNKTNQLLTAILEKVDKIRWSITEDFQDSRSFKGLAGLNIAFFVTEGGLYPSKLYLVYPIHNHPQEVGPVDANFFNAVVLAHSKQLDATLYDVYKALEKL